MKILFASPEVYPFAKSGELADVAGSLPFALHQLGHDVRVITPRYKMTDPKTFNLTEVVAQLDVPISNRVEPCAILQGLLHDVVPVYFIKNDTYFQRDYLYGDAEGDYPDNAERFIYFSRSILEACKALDFFPDVLHCNDWQTGLTLVYLRTIYAQEPRFAHTATVYTVHNIGYQGLFWHYDMHLTGLGWDLFTPNGLEFYGKINLMKGGLMWADVLTTVGPTYSEEIQTTEYGHGLEGVLQYRRQNLSGVIHGVDYTLWNPASDPLIAASYSAQDLAGKQICKRDLLHTLQLQENLDYPLIAMLSPLEDAKGCDLFAEIFEKALKLEANFILMGSGQEKYHKLFRHLGEKYAQKLSFRFDYDETLHHQVIAGADFYLMPSRHEPCGLNQIYSLRYGTIPIVHAVGGLNDTVKPFQLGTASGTGLKFTSYKAEALLQALNEALAVYDAPASWQALRLRALAEDFSWNVSAQAYEKLYHQAVAKFTP